MDSDSERRTEISKPSYRVQKEKLFQSSWLESLCHSGRFSKKKSGTFCPRSHEREEKNLPRNQKMPLTRPVSVSTSTLRKEGLDPVPGMSEMEPETGTTKPAPP